MPVRAVKPGSIVDVIAPASPCAVEELERGLDAARALGLEPRVPRDIFAGRTLFANVDAVRLEHLRRAIYAEDSNLIWCVRGGYGAIRLLPEMARWRKPKHPKVLLGYSDITSLHLFLNQRWDWATLHGPMIGRLGRQVSPTERRQQLDVIFGRTREVTFKNLTPINSAARRAGEIRGRVVGGNCAVLQSSLGTPFALRPRGRILFLEDIGERPHRVDRMLTQFEQAGVFRGVRAVVFGYFQLADPKDRRQLWREVMPRFADAIDVPVFKGLPCGHDPKKELTLPFNTPAVLKRGILTVSTGLAP